MNNNLACFILSHGRADRVYTYETLRNCGYTGPIYIIIDSLDKSRDEYIKRFGVQNVFIFDKEAVAKTTDRCDNFNKLNCVVYARNVNLEIAKNLGLKYFIQLDDDYMTFSFRFDNNLRYVGHKKITKLDQVFSALIEFLENTQITSLAISQGGDFIGGDQSTNASSIRLLRKIMNFYLCSTERPFQFLGTINEDTNTYVRLGTIGKLLFSLNQISLQQKQTQTNSGGLTEMYLQDGTYVKSFYTVIIQPSSVKVSLLNTTNPRLHHLVKWKNTVPRILSDSYKK